MSRYEPDGTAPLLSQYTCSALHTRPSHRQMTRTPELCALASDANFQSALASTWPVNLAVSRADAVVKCSNLSVNSRSTVLLAVK